MPDRRGRALRPDQPYADRLDRNQKISTPMTTPIETRQAEDAGQAEDADQDVGQTGRVLRGLDDLDDDRSGGPEIIAARNRP